jgi:hypothetical protein
MATKQSKIMAARTNFDIWRDSLTPEAIADSKFITFSCRGCPVFGKACNRYDAACRANFLSWARVKAETGATDAEPDAGQDPPEGGIS